MLFNIPKDIFRTGKCSFSHYNDNNVLLIISGALAREARLRSTMGK